jgi:hypothetical protein
MVEGWSRTRAITEKKKIPHARALFCSAKSHPMIRKSLLGIIEILKSIGASFSTNRLQGTQACPKEKFCLQNQSAPRGPLKSEQESEEVAIVFALQVMLNRLLNNAVGDRYGLNGTWSTPVLAHQA